MDGQNKTGIFQKLKNKLFSSFSATTNAENNTNHPNGGHRQLIIRGVLIVLFIAAAYLFLQDDKKEGQDNKGKNNPSQAQHQGESEEETTANKKEGALTSDLQPKLHRKNLISSAVIKNKEKESTDHESEVKGENKTPVPSPEEENDTDDEDNPNNQKVADPSSSSTSSAKNSSLNLNSTLAKGELGVNSDGDNKHKITEDIANINSTKVDVFSKIADNLKEQSTESSSEHSEKEANQDLLENSAEINPSPSEEIPPPTYDGVGRGLVYNCHKKHWACIDQKRYFDCKRHQAWSRKNKLPPKCVAIEVYVSNDNCINAQKMNINKIADTKFCN